MGREEERKGGGATVSICASLDSAATVRGREGLPRCGFHSKMINDVFVLSSKKILYPYFEGTHSNELIWGCGTKTKKCFIRFYFNIHAIFYIFNFKFKCSEYWQGWNLPVSGFPPRNSLAAFFHCMFELPPVNSIDFSQKLHWFLPNWNGQGVHKTDK